MPLLLVHAGLVVRHNAHCLVFIADRSKIRPFKSMVKLLHTRNFKQLCRLVGGVFCLILLLYEGRKLRNFISGYFRG